MSGVVTRFAPSPTGFLHVGGARTALFNWLYARHMGGKFVLRIEDTDLSRSSKEFVSGIFDTLEWLGIEWDDGPYFQTERSDLYKVYLERLLDSGKAYYCNCSKKSIDMMRQKAKCLGKKPRYDRKCRELNRRVSGNSVIRFKAPLDGSTIVDDAIKGCVAIQNSEQDDFVICRSDGIPTYNFVVVVDDITMGINTVIRGDDHLMNTPKQIMLYNAFEESLPVFGHVPMVLGEDKARLSKRHCAVSVAAYREKGYLPEAFINYLVRLGWSHGNQEFFTKEDLIKKFNLKNVGKSASIFNLEKLTALNAEHIRHSSENGLIRSVMPFMERKGYTIENVEYLKNVITTLRDRSKTLCDIADGAYFYYEEISLSYDKKASDKFLTFDNLELMTLLLFHFKKLESFNKKSQEVVFKFVMDETGLGFGKIAQPVRVALTGCAVSPGIFEIIEILGRNVVLARLEQAIDFIKEGSIA